jgi:sugar/nucleoside kinase (ribokinase family)
VSAPDFVAIGHVTLDRVGDRLRPGGTALYAAVTADRLGLSAGIVTSHGDDYPLDAIPTRIEVVGVPAPATTVFEYAEHADKRGMRVSSTARPLGPRDVPADWLDAGLVLLAPVIDEVDVEVVDVFDEATVAAAAQGWLRALDPGGRVRSRPWRPAPRLLDRVQALFVSHEDVRGQESSITEWVQRLPLVAVTAGAAGALLYVNGERYEIRPRPTTVVDPIGAGDVFAATFAIEYRRHGDPWAAAAAATCAASLAIGGDGWSTVPDRATLTAALAAYEGA